MAIPLHVPAIPRDDSAARRPALREVPAAGDEPSTAGITMLLGQHFGDGLVYLQGSDDRCWLRAAVNRGLVSEEGYLTAAGYRYWLSSH